MSDIPKLTHLPIDSEEADVLFFREKARQIAHFINNFDGSEPYAYAIYGDWGSGKSSLLNLVDKDLDRSKNRIIRFNPWNLLSHTAIIESLFSEIAAVIKEDKKVVSLFKKYGKKIFAPSVKGACQGALTALGCDSLLSETSAQSVSNVAEVVLFEDEPLSIRKQQLIQALSKWTGEGQKIVILIDELDRLMPEEMLSIFKLIKAYLDFPGLYFVVALDRHSAENALTSAGIKETRLYIDKIFQASHSICSKHQFEALTNYVLLSKLPPKYSFLQGLVRAFFLNDPEFYIEGPPDGNKKSGYGYVRSTLILEFSNPRSFIRLADFIINMWDDFNISVEDMNETQKHVTFVFLLLYYSHPELITRDYIGRDDELINSSTNTPRLFSAMRLFIEQVMLKRHNGNWFLQYDNEFADRIITIFHGFPDVVKTTPTKMKID